MAAERSPRTLIMPKPTLIIPDASIVLGYILNEPEHQAKIELLFQRTQDEQHQLLAPALLHEELCNRLGRILNFSISEIQAALEAYPVIKLTPGVTTQALQLTRRFPKIAWYDAVYHATALEYGGTLITADKQYYTTAQKTGSIVFIAHYV